MRADRLLSLVLLLQSRGRLTAGQLATESVLEHIRSHAAVGWTIRVLPSQSRYRARASIRPCGRSMSVIG